MERIGLDQAYRARTTGTLYTLEMHMHYLREVKSDATVTAEVRILGPIAKRIHAAFDLMVEGQAEPAACAETMLLHVQQKPTVSSALFPPEIATAITRLQQSTAALPASQFGSRQMQLPQR